MKHIFSGICAATLVVSSLVMPFTASAHTGSGDEYSCSHPHPNMVACYETGSHAIVGEQQLHYGFDEVWRDGNSNNFTQVFAGTGENGKQEVEQSQWNYIGDKTVCCDPKDFLVINAKGSGWGDYFPDGANYCVHNEEHPLH